MIQILIKKSIIQQKKSYFNLFKFYYLLSSIIHLYFIFFHLHHIDTNLDFNILIINVFSIFELILIEYYIPLIFQLILDFNFYEKDYLKILFFTFIFPLNSIYFY